MVIPYCCAIRTKTPEKEQLYINVLSRERVAGIIIIHPRIVLRGFTKYQYSYCYRDRRLNVINTDRLCLTMFTVQKPLPDI